MAVLQNLPTELFDAILSFVSPRQLLDIRLCNHFFNEFISSSPLAQYRIECWRANVCNIFVASSLSYSDRLSRLRRHEHAWHTLEVQKKFDIQTSFASGYYYDFSQGVIALGRAEGVEEVQGGYSTLQLPSAQDASVPQWVHNTLLDALADYSMDVEQDLIAVVTSKPASGAVVQHIEDLEIDVTTHSFDLHIRSISKGDYHARAAIPVVPLCSNFPFAQRAGTFVQVAGEHVLVVLVHPYALRLTPRNDDVDVLYSVHWPSGRVHEVCTFEARMYQGFVFLRADVLLFCNLEARALDVYEIVWGKSPATALQLILSCSLLLPSPQTQGLQAYQCRAEPQVRFPAPPDAQRNSPSSGRSFYNDPDTAIVLFSMMFPWHTATLIVHRDRLLQAFLHGRRDGLREVPYGTWGGDICRWLDFSGAWITQSAGQRFVAAAPVWVGEENEGGVRLGVRVFDFNPHTVRRTLKELGGRTQVKTANGNTLIAHTEVWITAAGVPNSWPDSKLSYVETILESVAEYADIMLDDERIIKIYMMSKIEVLVIAP